MTFSGPQPYLVIVISAINLAIALFVVYRGRPRIVNWSFFLFTAGMSLWSFAIAMLYLTHDFTFDKIILGAALPIFYGLVLFARVFPEETAFPPSMVYFLLPMVWLLGLIASGMVTSGITVGVHGIVMPTLGPLFPFFALIVLAYVLSALIFFARNFADASPRGKMQMTYLAFGIFGCVGIALVCEVLLPMFGIYQFNLLGTLGTVIFTFSVAYSIVRYQLMDIRLILQRGLIFTTLLGSVVALYLALVNTLGFVFDTTAGTLWSAGVTTLVGIFTVPFIDRFLRKHTDHIFFKGKYDYALALQSLSEILHTSTDFNELVFRMQEKVAGLFRAERVEIVLYAAGALSRDLRQEYAELLQDHTVLFEPICVDTEEIGGILVLQKRSGDRYRSEDSQLLHTFSINAATALARAQLFRQVQEYAIELENKVQKRTEELKLLQEGQKQMMLDIAHSLQTPLTVFQTKLERLKMINQDLIDVEAFEHSLMNLSGFIENLLTLAQLENGTRERQRASLSLSLLVRDIAEEVETIAQARGIRVECHIERGLSVNADTKDLRCAIMNLASNAIKYMKRGGVREIAFSLAKKGEEAHLTIRDSGVGISKEDLARIFERFYRIGNKAGIAGSGLGLPITKEIIEQHGGAMHIESEVGVGTTISISLPLLVVAEDTDETFLHASG